LADQPKKRKQVTNPAAREQRRAAIATGVIAGKTVSTIAGELGLARETVSREAGSDETRGLIRSMLAPHCARLERILDRSITVVERALVDDSETRGERVNAIQLRIDNLQEIIGLSADPDPWLLRELREHEKHLREDMNDYIVNLKAVERARDLLELGRDENRMATATIPVCESSLESRKLSTFTESSPSVPVPCTDHSQRDALIAEHIDWARRLAEREARKLPRQFTADDLTGPAEAALLDAAAEYDPSRGVPFRAYAVRLIRWRCLDAVRRKEYFERTLSSLSAVQTVDESELPAFGWTALQVHEARAPDLVPLLSVPI
jgi:predicted transcriptional regulator